MTLDIKRVLIATVQHGERTIRVDVKAVEASEVDVGELTCIKTQKSDNIDMMLPSEGKEMCSAEVKPTKSQFRKEPV